MLDLARETEAGDDLTAPISRWAADRGDRLT